MHLVYVGVILSAAKNLVTEVYTRSGKKIELAETRLIHGETLQNITAFANPKSLKEYELLREKL